jgi:serine/threonine protein kinase
MQTPSGRVDRIGRYEVLRRISSGRLAQLFVAKQIGAEGFAKVVCIRRIHDELASDTEFVKSFLEEARLVARLSHPNIIQIYDLGKHGDAFFIAMEYVAGRNLARIRKKARDKGSPLPSEFAVRWIADVCAGLHYAHSRVDHEGKPLQIVHRGVSPRKIIVDFTGGVKLGEFGTAKATTQLALTRPTMLEGDYGYMSPEQARSDKIDARSDVFAIGSILYELVTGHHPFKRGNAILTLNAINEERQPESCSVSPDVTKSLSVIIDRALEKRRSKRWQSAEELQSALEDHLSASMRRFDRTTTGETIKQLFEEELVKGRAVVDFPGVGDIILPEVDEQAEEQPFFAKPTEMVPEDATVASVGFVTAPANDPLEADDGFHAPREQPIVPFEPTTDSPEDPPPMPPVRVSINADTEITPLYVAPGEVSTGVDLLETPTLMQREDVDTLALRGDFDASSFETKPELQDLENAHSSDFSTGMQTRQPSGEPAARTSGGIRQETGIEIDFGGSSVVADRQRTRDPADELPLLEFPSVTEREPLSDDSAPKEIVPKLDTSAFLGPAEIEDDPGPKASEQDAVLEAAFAEFAPEPKNTSEEPPSSEPIPLDADALLPLGLEPSLLEKEGTRKREIKEVFRPGPQAPTEFLSGLAEQAEAALRSGEIAPLPEIVRDRVAPSDAPVVKEVAAIPPPSILTAASDLLAPVPTIPPAATSPPIVRLETANDRGHLEPVGVARVPPLRIGAAPKSPAARPPPAPLMPLLHELPPDPRAEVEPPPMPPPPVLVDAAYAVPAAQDPLAALNALAPGAVRRAWSTRWSPRLFVAIMATAVAAALTLLAITASRGRHEVQLMITSVPTEADIYVNGDRQPVRTNATIRGLKPGTSYELRIEKEGYQSTSRLVAIPRETRTYVVEVRLEPRNP